jgi:hypothetical protein
MLKETDASLKRYTNVQAAFAAGYTYVLKINGEERLLYDGGDPSYQGLNPQDHRRLRRPASGWLQPGHVAGQVHRADAPRMGRALSRRRLLR